MKFKIYSKNKKNYSLFILVSIKKNINKKNLKNNFKFRVKIFLVLFDD